ncbi:MAG: Gfo/Idh/MocA family oxidoreductase [Christensenellaceae bacterium]
MLKSAIIGTGFIGNAHATAYQNIKNVQLAAIVDVNEEKGKAAAKEFNCKYYSDAEEMLKNEDVDIVDVCLPTFLHEQYVVLAAKYKKNVICEKPVTLTLESMDNMIQATQKAGVKFMVAQVVRFWPEYVKIKEMFDAGAFGDVKMVYANRIAQHPNWTQWHKNPKNSGGGLFDLHLHDIDFLQYLFGDVKSVYAVGKASETGCWNHVMTTLKFKDGNAATAEGIFDMTENYPFTMTFRIVGESRTVDYSMVAGFNLEDVASSKRAAMLYENGCEPKKLGIEETDAYQIELQYFADAIEKNEPIKVVTPENSRHVVEIMLAIQKSLETGNVVELSK